MAEGWLPVLVTDTVYRWGIFLFLAAFSVAEIPIMIFGLGRLATSANPRAKYVVLLANAGYPFFGAVYAAPFILLTGQLALGTAMAALSFVRFATAVIFLAR